MVNAILGREPAWRRLPAATPSGIHRILRRCLQKDPEHRLHDIADARIEIEEALVPTSEESVAPATRKQLPLQWMMAALLVGAAAGALSLAYLRRGPPSTGAPAPITAATIELPASAPLGIGTAAMGLDGTLLALSPDGRWLVYVGESGGMRRLYRRALDAFDEPHAIAGTEGAVHVFFSPEGRDVGFGTDDKIKRVSIEGDDLRVLCDAYYPTHGTWAENDTIYFAARFARQLWRVPAEGGGPAEQIVPQGDFRSGYFADALPDGRGVFVSVRGRSAAADQNRIVVVDTATGNLTQLVASGYDPRYLRTGHVVFARGRNLMAVAFDRERRKVISEPVPVLRGVATESFFGRAQIAFSASGSVAYVPGADRTINRVVRVDRRGGEEAIKAPPAPYNVVAVSPDGGRLALHVADVNDYVLIWDLRRHEGRRLPGFEVAGWPIWSPAGDFVAVRAWPPGSAGALCIQRPDGGGPPSIIHKFDGEGSIRSWKAGAIMISDRTSGSHVRMGLVPVPGSGRLEWLEFNCGANVGALSPDGRWVACDEQGEIFVRSLADPTIVRQVSTDGGIEPVWCPSGELFFRKGRRWFATTISFAPELHWNPPTPAFETDFLDTVGVSYDVSPDGRHLYVMKPAVPDERRKLHIVTGWADELRRRVPSAGAP
jgi:hypothetical protein